MKSALPLGDTIERLSKIKLERTSNGFKACCPFHDDKSPSFHVREDRGLFRCFGAGCEAGGDVLDFIQQWFGVGFKDALIKAGELAGLPPPGPERVSRANTPSLDSVAWRAAVPERRKPRPARLIPSSKYLKPFPQGMTLPCPGEIAQVRDEERGRKYELRPTHVHNYKDVEGGTRCLVLRAESRRKGKFFVQVGFKNGEDAVEGMPWRLLRFPAGVSRPVYGLEDVSAWSASGGRRVLLVEGEKTRDCAAKLLPIESTGVLVLANMGGCNAAGYADWSPLVHAISSRGEFAEPAEVAIWPDADKPTVRPNGQVVDGRAAFAASLERSLSAAAKTVGVGRADFAFRMVKPPSGVESGWDLADAHSEGWTGENVLEAIDRSSVRLGSGGIPSAASRFRGIGELRSAGAAKAIVASDNALRARVDQKDAHIPELDPMQR